jgi:hypothetical protein
LGVRARGIALASLALGLAALPGPALAQLQSSQPPPPPPADTTTHVEKPDAVPPVPTDPPPVEPVQPSPTEPNVPEQKAPEHVPQDASGFRLSTLETKNLSLLYIDPVQTYLTPYLGRAFENALGKRQPFKRSAMHFVKELLESGLIETRADGALPKLSVKG